MREADSALHDHKYTAEDVKVEPLDPSDAEAEPLEEQSYHVGSKCRFRYTDGRWYNGVILGLEGLDSAKISFLSPTSENMLVRAMLGYTCLSCVTVIFPLKLIFYFILSSYLNLYISTDGKFV